jgi:hypothetical protein
MLSEPQVGSHSGRSRDVCGQVFAEWIVPFHRVATPFVNENTKKVWTGTALTLMKILAAPTVSS